MPELPEVETVKNVLSAHLIKQCVQTVIVRQPQLRWPIPANLAQLLHKQTILSIQRRAKYLLFEFEAGWLLAHLGMSGAFFLVDHATPLKKHDHIDIVFKDYLLRYHDPRRFGALLWTTQPISQHPRLKQLGPEPLSNEFNAKYLYALCQSRNIAIKQLIMMQTVVVGVGNIYACEALFESQMNPFAPANTLTISQITRLIKAIKNVLNKAIDAGGTTLRDFSNGHGKPGYFQQQLAVYGKNGEPCIKCDEIIQSKFLSGRNTYFCSHCQRT